MPDIREETPQPELREVSRPLADALERGGGLDPALQLILDDAHPETLYNEYTDEGWARGESEAEALALFRDLWGEDYCDWGEVGLDEEWMRPELLARDDPYYAEQKAEMSGAEPIVYVKVPAGAPGAVRYWKLPA